MTLPPPEAPRTFHAGAADPEPDAVLALQAFLPCVALLDTALQVVRWCSAGFSARMGLEAGDPLSAVRVRVPGAALAIDSALCSRRPTARGGTRALRVGLGLIALCVDDPVDAEPMADARGHRPAQGGDCDRLVRISSALAVTELAATLAHEINQPLGAVVNVLQGLRLRLAGSATAPSAGLAPDPDPDASLNAVTLALDQAHFAASLVARHRHCHAVEAVLAPLDLAATVREALGPFNWALFAPSEPGKELEFVTDDGAQKMEN
jgi:signal transduction histidine kinase